MAASRGWEREFLAKGFSRATVAFLRDIETVVQPSVISLDITELEALQHEFRLLRNTLDTMLDRIQNLEASMLNNLLPKNEIDEVALLVNQPNVPADETLLIEEISHDQIENRLQELEALAWQT